MWIEAVGGEFARGAPGGSFRGGSSWGFTRGRGRWPVSTMLPHAGASRSSGARLQTRAPPRPVRRAPSEKNRTSPKPHFDWYPPSGVCLGARKRRGVSGAGTHVIDVRDDGHVADVVLLVHLATELIDGELRREGRRGTGPSAVRARALKRWGGEQDTYTRSCNNCKVNLLSSVD